MAGEAALSQPSAPAENTPDTGAYTVVATWLRELFSSASLARLSAMSWLICPAAPSSP